MTDKPRSVTLICLLVMQGITDIRLRLRAHLLGSVSAGLFPIESPLGQDGKIPCVLGLQLSLEGTRTPTSCPGLKAIQIYHSLFPSPDF